MRSNKSKFMHFLSNQSNQHSSRNNSIKGSHIKNNSIAFPLTSRNTKDSYTIKPTHNKNSSSKGHNIKNSIVSKNQPPIYPNTSRNPINKTKNSIISKSPINTYMDHSMCTNQAMPMREEIKLKETIKKQFKVTLKYTAIADNIRNVNLKLFSLSPNPKSPISARKSKFITIGPKKESLKADKPKPTLKDDLIPIQTTNQLKNPFSPSSTYYSKSKEQKLSTKSIPAPKPIPKDYMTPQEVLSTHKLQLIEYEMAEILTYPEIYCFGRLESKLLKVDPAAQNQGWDDEKGFYKLKIRDHLNYRYDVTSILGNGSFGITYLCTDMKTHEKVAIKILRNKEKYHKQGKLEVEILETLNKTSSVDSQYIVKIIDHFVFRSHICIVCEVLSINLFQLIQSYKFEVY
jgi:hypothetical protein